jgi:hypothetical protein
MRTQGRARCTKETREFLERIRAGVPNRRGSRRHVAQNHYTTKTKRRQKSKKRKDSSQATMAKLRELAAAEAKRAGK